MFHCHVGFFQGTPGPCALPQSWPSVEVDACKSPARKCPNPELGRCILTHAYRYLLISIDLIYPSSASYPSYPSLYLGHLPVFFIWSLIPCFADHHSTHLGWKSKTSLLSEPPTKNWLVAPGPRPWLDHDPHICGNLKGLHSLHHLKHRKYRN
jgi:hypothetical protein